MRTKPVGVCELAFLIVGMMGAGCSPNQKVTGQIFVLGGGGKTLPQPGVCVYLLAASQHRWIDFFLAPRAQWLKNELEQQLKLATPCGATNGLTSLYRAYHPADTRSDDQLALDLSGQFPDAAQKVPGFAGCLARAKADEAREQLHTIPMSDPNVAAVLPKVRRVVSDASGAIQFNAPQGTEYWVLAQSGGFTWYFRYVADGTPLILSDNDAL